MAYQRSGPPTRCHRGPSPAPAPRELAPRPFPWHRRGPERAARGGQEGADETTWRLPHRIKSEPSSGACKGAALRRHALTHIARELDLSIKTILFTRWNEIGKPAWSFMRGPLRWPPKCPLKRFAIAR